MHGVARKLGSEEKGDLSVDGHEAVELHGLARQRWIAGGVVCAVDLVSRRHLCVVLSR
jgi:hypothetical protein